MNKYVILWGAWLISGNPIINQSIHHNYTSYCEGATVIMAKTEADARAHYSRLFPDDKIVAVKNSLD